MCNDNGSTLRRIAARLALMVAVAGSMSGCQTARNLLALPFDVAGYAAAETARLPYETAKMGVQGVFDVIAGAMR